MEWYDIVSRIGFPIFVAVYLLCRHDRIIRELKDTIRELTEYLKGKNGK